MKASGVAFLAVGTLGLCAALASPSAEGQQLFGLSYLSGQGEVFRLDPTSGSVTPVMPTGSPVISDDVGFDPIGKRMFFQWNAGGAPPFFLTTVNLATGTTSTVAIAGGSNYFGFMYDGATGSLLALSTLAGHGEVFRLDPTSGSVTPVMPTGSPVISDDVGFDPVGKRMFFQWNAGGVPPFFLTTMNLATGTTSTVTIAGGSNYFGFQYDANVAPGPASIPALGPAAAVCMIGLLLVVGFRVLRA